MLGHWYPSLETQSSIHCTKVVHSDQTSLPPHCTHVILRLSRLKLQPCAFLAIVARPRHRLNHLECSEVPRGRWWCRRGNI
jgi:hypothetical protein